jgi:hypothetical protein
MKKVFTDNSYYSATLKKDVFLKLKTLSQREDEFKEIKECIEEYKKEA